MAAFGLGPSGAHVNAAAEPSSAADAAEKKVDPKLLDSYVGQYELQPGFVITIRRRGDGITGQATGQSTFDLFARSETHFFLKEVDAQITFVREADGKTSRLILHQNGDHSAKKISDEVPKPRVPDLAKIPARDPKASDKLLDLSGQYNARLDDAWHPDSGAEILQQNHLGALPGGIQTFAGVQFDVRGVVQLSGRQLEGVGGNFPKEIKGIRVGKKCAKLHFLGGTGWSTEDGTRIGSYIIHFAGGQTAELPIAYGADVRDWWSTGDDDFEAKNASVAWKGANAATEQLGASLRLFKSTLENPQPDLVIESVDFMSAMAESAPFLIAITIE